ncbi:hypothetical protein A8135_11080 [Legionella jamestowniensis]|uniref:Coiled-coil protein n=1 Tax=Legionella jamestowniensis TaxID=455 RepID=A0ABX2XVH8_9GAMM|nr:hypothetical protein [Legionella jamestowniensis]OCH98619.1 hypothetical protein A8135_11080 [Legionella jamestowniensis]
MFDFIHLIKTKNFSAIIKPLHKPNNIQDDSPFELKDLEVKILRYNQEIASLNEKLSPPALSKTAAIVEIFQTFQRQQQYLLEIFKTSATLALLYKNQNGIHKELVNLKLAAGQQLKINRHFKRWAASVVPEQSLYSIPHVISRNVSESWPSKAKGYVEAADDDNTSEKDKGFVLRGEGVPLPPRLQREALDPKHRAWGTMYPAIRHALKPVHDAWVNGDKEEDLTVEVAFDEALQQKEKLFDPAMIKEHWEELAADDARWFNSFNYYLDATEALDYLVTTNEQKQLCWSDNKPVDTQKKEYIFVMDLEGNLFISPEGAYREGKRIGHSSFTQGNPVASAGSLVIENGEVTLITNLSGHYQPGGHSLYRVVAELNKRGVLGENCKIKVNRDDDFPYVKNGRSVAEFKEQYEKNIGKAHVPELNLSEKPNPQRLLNSLTKINRYLSKRAGETSSFLKFFGSYTGVDYYGRRNSFRDLLDRMRSRESIDTIIQCIDEHLPYFSNGRRHDYADSLKELKAALIEYKKFDSSVFEVGLIQETLTSYQSLYDSMDKYTSAAFKFYRSGSSKHDESLAAMENEKIGYKFLRKEVRSGVKNEFAKDDLLVEQEYNNVANFN